MLFRSLAKIQELTPKPVTRIINTHSHGDHVSGNPEYPATVEIVSHEATVKNVEAWPPVYGLNNAFPDVIRDAGGKGMPKRTFKDRLTLGKDADRIDLFFFGRGHTSGDAWVLFTALKVLVAADDFPSKGVPIMDKNAGGSGAEFAATVTKAYNTVKEADTIITGHSPTTMTREDLKVYGDFLRDFVAAVSAAKKAGQTPDQFAASWKVPEKYTGYPPAQAASVKNAATVEIGRAHV